MANPDIPNAPWGTVETRFKPIHSAARMRDAEAVRQELDAGVDVDVPNGRAKNGDGGNTALWFAAQGPAAGGVEVARLLIAAGADVNRNCEHGRTALQMAVAWGHLDMVQFLIENGADPCWIQSRSEDSIDSGQPSPLAHHCLVFNAILPEQHRFRIPRDLEALWLHGVIDLRRL